MEGAAQAAEADVDLAPPSPLAAIRARLGPAPSYWLTRFVVLRLLGFVYLAAFLSLLRELGPLLGSHGLTPAAPLLARAAATHGGAFAGFVRAPSLFWLSASDGFMTAMAWLGAALSLAVLFGYANAIMLAVLWFLYLSFVQIGQDWFGFGWEIQLTETGLLAIFLVPLLDGRPFPHRPPPWLAILLLRWLAFRIMLGAGLIKWRGDPCWRDLTCLDFHFETQPNPGPLSRWFHELPGWIHAGGVVFNHLAELVAPWFLFGPRFARHLAGAIMLGFQLSLIASGNLAFLNWLTIIPILACFDDGLLARVLPRLCRRAAELARARAVRSRAQLVIVAGFAAIVALASTDVVANLASPHQRMNASYNRLNLGSTYGAFGSVGRERPELVIEGTADAVPDEHATWRAYELPCKPGDPMRRPCSITPIHYRLDWLMWFAAMGDLGDYPWVAELVWQLLHGEPELARLFAVDPFADGPPRFIRVVRYRYRFAAPDDPSGAYWTRERLGLWLRPVAADDRELAAFLAEQGFRPAAP